MFKIKKILLVLLVLSSIHSHNLYAQATEKTPQKVYRYCYVINSKDWYRNQEKLWKLEILKNPQNEDAWYNYFFAARYGWSVVKGRTYTREALMDSIYKEMGKAIPNSWVYHYIHYYNYGTDFSHLQKAYKINPHIPDLYWEFIKEYELNGKKPLKKEFCQKLYESKDISSAILNLNYNMLISTESNSILFTNGDNDTYPSWVIQDAKGIREDILILNVHAIFGDKKYLNSRLKAKGIELNIPDFSDIPTFFEKLIEMINDKYPQTPIHIAQTVAEDYYQTFRKDLFLTGIAYTYKKQAIDINTLHQEIVENKLRLDYLNFDWYDDLHVSEPLVNQYNLVYVEPFLQLAKHYHSNGDISSAKKWTNKALFLSKRADDDDLIEKIENLNW